MYLIYRCDKQISVFDVRFVINNDGRNMHVLMSDLRALLTAFVVIYVFLSIFRLEI